MNDFSLAKRALTEVFQISIASRGTQEAEGRKTIVITLNKVCKGRLRGRLRKELPSLGLSLFSRLVGRLRRLEVICEGAGQSYILGDYNLLKNKHF
ncbi:hypothetical protein D6923_25335 [Escherichia coli]|nr:hypothetical protein [Escherichia coli]